MTFNPLAVNSDQYPVGSTLNLLTEEGVARTAVVQPDAGAGSFARGNVGSVGGSYAADGIATPLLTDVSGSPVPAELTLAATLGDLLEGRATLRFLVAQNTVLNITMRASDDNFATSDVIEWTLIQYTSKAADFEVDPTIIGVYQVPRTGTWKLRIYVQCVADPDGTGVTWVDEPLWFAGNNWGQAVT